LEPFRSNVFFGDPDSLNCTMNSGTATSLQVYVVDTKNVDKFEPGVDESYRLEIWPSANRQPQLHAGL